MKACVLQECFVLFCDLKYWHVLNLLILKYSHIKRHQISFWKLLLSSNRNT